MGSRPSLNRWDGSLGRRGSTHDFGSQLVKLPAGLRFQEGSSDNRRHPHRGHEFAVIDDARYAAATTAHDTGRECGGLHVAADQVRADFTVWNQLDFTNVVEGEFQEPERSTALLGNDERVSFSIGDPGGLYVGDKLRHVIVIG